MHRHGRKNIPGTFAACRFCVGFGSDHLAHLISPQCLTQSRLFSKYLGNEYMCMNKSVKEPEGLKKFQRGEMMLEKWVRATSASLRKSRSSRQIRAQHGMSRREILAELCFNTIDLEQCAEQTRRREKLGSLGPRSSESLCANRGRG